MKTLFFCNTNYQLIVALQIALSFDKKCSILITNEIKNCEELSERLRETGIFEYVATIDVKKPRNSFVLLCKCLIGQVPKEIRDCIFDEFVGFNLDIHSHIVFAYFYNKNREILVNRMEEGLLSLNTPDSFCKVLSYSYFIRRLLNKDNLRNIVSGFYCFLPQANKNGVKSIQIPMIRPDSAICNYLRSIFSDGIEYDYKEKYIFISCVYDFEGEVPIGELELAQRIADRVGYDNLLVKVHPRDNKERYQKAGLKVDKNSVVPFEVIQIENDFSSKILITSLSGSLLNFNPVIEKPSVSYYAYNLCNIERNHLAKHYKSVLESYINNRTLGLRNIKLLESIEELL